MDGCAFWVGTRSLPVETPRSNLQGLGGEKTVHSCHIYIFQTVWKAVNIWKTTKKYGLAQQAAQRFDEAGVFGLFNQTKFRREKRHEFFQGGIYIIVYHPSPHPLKVATNHHELSSQRAPPSSAAPSVVFLSSLAFLVDAFPSLFAPVHEPKVFLLEVFTQCYPTRKIVGWDQRIFLEFLSHKVGIGIEVDFYNLWDLWPWKKKDPLTPLDINMIQNVHVESWLNMKQKQHATGFCHRAWTVPFLWAAFPRLLFVFSTIPQRSSVDAWYFRTLGWHELMDPQFMAATKSSLPYKIRVNWASDSLFMREGDTLSVLAKKSNGSWSEIRKEKV